MRIFDIGVLVNTHGLKGEVRIVSDFDYKDKIFVVGNHLLIGGRHQDLEITSYRKHKQYDMVTFKGYNTILEVNAFKGQRVFYDTDSLELKENEIIDADLVGIDAYFEDKLIGKISGVEINGNRKLFVINDKLIPYNDNFIINIDIKNKRINLKNLNGLI